MFTSEVADRCEAIRQLVDRIEVDFVNSGIEGTTDLDDCSEIITSLEQTEQDLEGTLRLLQNY